ARRLVAAADANWLAGQTTRVASLLDRAQPLLADPGLRATSVRLQGSVEIERGMPANAYGLLMTEALEIVEREPVAALEMLSRANDAAWLCGRADWAAEVGRIADTILCHDSDEAFVVA